MDQTTAALDVFRADLHARTRAFTALHESDQRRYAVRAAAEKNLEQLWTVFEAYLTLHGRTAAKASKHTLRNYKLGLRMFLSHAESNAWNLLSPARHAAQLWINELMVTPGEGGRVLKPASVRLYAQSARGLYRALRWVGATESDPFQDITLPKDSADSLISRPPYREDMLLTLLDRAEPPIHLEVLLLLCAHGGLRIDEAVHVVWTDVQLTQRRLTVRSGKGGKLRRVPLSERLTDALQRHKLQTNASGGATLFRYHSREGALYHLKKLVDATQQQTGLQWSDFRGFHAFRKLAGTKLYRRRKDLGAVASFLGHADISTSRRYALITADDYAQDVADW